jgi:hypothetical protein
VIERGRGRWCFRENKMEKWHWVLDLDSKGVDPVCKTIMNTVLSDECALIKRVLAEFFPNVTDPQIEVVMREDGKGAHVYCLGIVVDDEDSDSILHMAVMYETAKAMGDDFFNDPDYISKVIDYSLHQAKAGIRVPGVWKGEAEPLNRYYPAIYDADKKQYTVPEKNVTLEEWLRLTIHGQDGLRLQVLGR